jgi:hypothetical protein
MSKYTAVAITVTLATWLFVVVAVAVTGVRPYDPTSPPREASYRVAAVER